MQPVYGAAIPVVCCLLIMPLRHTVPFTNEHTPCTMQHVAKASSGAGEEDDELKKDWKFGRNEGPMTWGWKLMCAILYMLPWVDVTEKTVYFIERFPAFHWTEYFTGKFGLAWAHKHR